MAAAAGAAPASATLLVFTHSYPHLVEREETFVEPQLAHLRAAFARVVVVPFRTGGGTRNLPAGIELDEGLAASRAGRARTVRFLAGALADRLFWAELAREPWILRSPRALKRLVVAAGHAAQTGRWFRRAVRSGVLDPAACVAYTFWCDGITAGLARAKDAHPGLRVVTRVNGYDLFLERHRPPYLPLRHQTLRRLDRVYAVSECGMRYTLEHHPWFAPRCEVARLGVDDPGGLSPAPVGGQVVVASCSRLVDVKRVDRIACAVSVAARRRPDLAFAWHHFGDGETAGAVEHIARTELPANATATLHGHRSTAEILAFYRREPVAVFVNASSTEGGSPVAIMEAASCGIPVVATDVGGNPEIVSARNGVLVAADPGPGDLADALLAIVEDPATAAAMREGSRQVWAERFVAEANYAAFARRLADLREARLELSDRPGPPGSSGPGS